jgi:hypothetical protein
MVGKPGHEKMFTGSLGYLLYVLMHGKDLGGRQSSEKC